jgi:hypothetical protein
MGYHYRTSLPTLRRCHVSKDLSASFPQQTAYVVERFGQI